MGVIRIRVGQFNEPYGIAVNDSGFVFVADSSNNRIQVFTEDGIYANWWGSKEQEMGSLTIHIVSQ